MGLYNTQVVYIFDFGLARQILLPGDGGRLRLREPRNKVSLNSEAVRNLMLSLYSEKNLHPASGHQAPP
ncbi:hypothetical protein ANCCEY_05504 [Ancylostoma ceylanicum]|uniref:Uncharacterized protein n=1 Tax=Ancylostoma ceylanicum TaxID=53326 RepID=A0A0D6LTL5_9BILA|nr:hypothetical protein ANCCEY_05504 [Ancylostoma ceylanicum]